ncbi:MAG: methylglyoxal synthase [Moorea sp. SIOASIH]|uniref:methylglyoxal synthase n=1 Tax=Moorena sp. SIOASIH TaxID=2607817 RepID=UPI0013BC7D99|nr:methylglyoxal synthase [Moorena sp. SIOASIH]NEO38964.1 methylglyoxal synthase [Moorena sp. SIOASIH]
MPATIALIAHDNKKNDIVAFVKGHQIVFSRYTLIATGNTGKQIQNSTGLPVDCLLPGPIGGDAQLFAAVAEGKVCAVFFFIDALYAKSHEPDIQPLLRICDAHDVAIATNLATAELVISALARTQVAHLIFNPVAGQGDSDHELTIIENMLGGHFNLEIHQTTLEITAEELTKRAIAAHADLIIASGGDGTVSAVASQVIDTNIPLGIIPRGTANAFCQALGIGGTVMPIRAACRIISEGYTKVIDAARCNDTPMILLTGIGFEAEMVDKASREFKDQWGVLAYLVAGWQQLDEQELFDAAVEIEDQIYRVEVGAITVANAAPPTSVLAQGMGEVIYDDGLLDVTMAKVDTKLQAVTSMVNAFGAALVRLNPNQENIHHVRTHSIKIATDPPQKVVVDGEVIGTTPIKVECIPNGLTVFVPNPN